MTEPALVRLIWRFVCLLWESHSIMSSDDEVSPCYGVFTRNELPSNFKSATFAFHRQTPRDEVRKEAKHLIYTHVCNLKKPVSFPLLLWAYTSQQAVFSVMTMTCLKRFSKDNPWREAGNKNDQAGPCSVRWRSLVLVAGDWGSFP